MLEAKRPVLYTGGGVVLSGAAHELTELTRELGFPDYQYPDGFGCLPVNG